MNDYIHAQVKIWRLFLFSLVITVVVAGGLQITGKKLITPDVPGGIISFEFAGDLNKAESIIDSWGNDSKIFAAFNLGLDYLFLVFYSVTLASGSLLVTNRISTKPNMIRTGHTIAVASLVAGLLDAVENYALFQILTGRGSNLYAALAAWCAVPKFILVGIAIIYIFSGGLFLLINSKTKTGTNTNRS